MSLTGFEGFVVDPALEGVYRATAGELDASTVSTHTHSLVDQVHSTRSLLLTTCSARERERERDRNMTHHITCELLAGPYVLLTNIIAMFVLCILWLTDKHFSPVHCPLVGERPCHDDKSV